MALPEERKAGLLAYCRIDELTPAEETLLEAVHDAAVGYMTQAGVREPETGTPRRAQYDLCVNYLVLDSWDNRDMTFTGAAASENPAFRRLLNQLKLTEPEGPPPQTSKACILGLLQNPQILWEEEEGTEQNGAFAKGGSGVGGVSSDEEAVRCG